MEEPSTNNSGSYQFGPFILDPAQRLFLHCGEPIGLPPKVFDTLRVLVENDGRLVSKDDLMNAIWPDVVVEEGNLKLTIHLVRKTLSRDKESKYIETVPKRGYRFVGEVRTAAETNCESEKSRDDHQNRRALKWKLGRRSAVIGLGLTLLLLLGFWILLPAR